MLVLKRVRLPAYERAALLLAQGKVFQGHKDLPRRNHVSLLDLIRRFLDDVHEIRLALERVFPKTDLRNKTRTFWK